MTDRVRYRFLSFFLFKIESLFIAQKLCNYGDVYAKYCEGLAHNAATLAADVLEYRAFVQQEKELMHMRREEERKAELMKKQTLQEEQKKFQLESRQKDAHIFHTPLEVIAQRGDSTEAGIPRIIDSLIDLLERKGKSIVPSHSKNLVCCIQHRIRWGYSELLVLPLL